MFTLQCTTCNAKLAVKNENLAGQIAACPKCGSMVLIQPPEESLLPPVPFYGNEGEQEVPFPTDRFSDGMPFQEPADAFRRDFNETKEQAAVIEAIPEKELRTRRILMGILAGFVIVLLITTVVLSLHTADSRPQTAEEITEQANDSRNNQIAESRPVEIEKHTADSRPQTAEEIIEQANDSRSNQIAESRPVGTEKHTADRRPQTAKEITEQANESRNNQIAVIKDNVNENNVDENKKDKLAELLAKPPIETANGRQQTAEVVKEDGILSGIQSKMPNLLKNDAYLTLDVPARLALPLKKWTLSKTPLLNVLRQFSDITEIPFTLDIDELLCRNISPDTPITITCEDETAESFLQNMLQTQGLTFAVAENQITITVPETERNKIIEQSFDVSDIASVLPLEDIRSYIGQLFIFPADTAANVNGSTVVFRHTKKYVEHFNRLLEQLRVLRGLKQKTEIPPEKLVPLSFGWDAVCVPMTLNYYQPEPLANVLEQIEKTARLNIFVDNSSLHRSLVSLKTLTASIHCNKEPVNTALLRLLSSVDEVELNYRIVSENILEVSTLNELVKPEKMTIEIHRFETEEKKLTETPEELVRTLKTAVAPEMWASADNPKGGVIVIDKPTGCLFVRQSQKIQRELRFLLAKKTSE